MRFKTTGLIILITFLFLVLGLLWQFGELQRTSADTLQISEESKVQPNSVENDSVTFTINSDSESAAVGQIVTYTISYSLKRDMEKSRIVGVLGDTSREISPSTLINLGDLKAGTNGSITIPVEIKKGDKNLIIARVAISEVERPTWWGKEKRKTLATADKILPLNNQ
ncbi:MAG: hypothetical protein NT135_02555 [Candidatus Berkelbacteria bacterium]|nr:hypothetical protein [Candidatus Berkelbacteria bacterium]